MRKQGFQGTNITFLRLFLGEIGDVVPNHSAPPQLKETEKAVRQRKMRKLQSKMCKLQRKMRKLQCKMRKPGALHRMKNYVQPLWICIA